MGSWVSNTSRRSREAMPGDARKLHRFIQSFPKTPYSRRAAAPAQVSLVRLANSMDLLMQTDAPPHCNVSGA